MAARSLCDELFDEFIASLVERTKRLQIELASSVNRESDMLVNAPTSRGLLQAPITPRSPRTPRLLELSNTPRSPRSFNMPPVPKPGSHGPDVTWPDQRALFDLLEESFAPYVIQRPGSADFNRKVDRWGRVTWELITKKATCQLAMLRSVWLLGQESLQNLQSPYRNHSSCTEAEMTLHMGDISQYDGFFLNSLVRHPDKIFSAVYICTISFVAAYDLASFPFILIVETDKGPHWELLMMLAWISATIWSLDLPMSCFQGFYTTDGVVEMRLGQTCVQYLKSWFLIDLIMNVTDWITCAQMNDSGRGVLQFARVLRVFRFVRVVRLLRSTDKMKAMVIENLVSDELLLVSRLMFLLLAILFISHYIACAWLALARNTLSDLELDSSWIRTHDLENSDPLLQYTASLHWCLAQFTPATTNIAPTNVQERLFAIVVVIFGLVMFSTFVSSLTSAVVELKRIRSSRYAEVMQIKRYLKIKQVSLDTCKKIWAYYKKQYRVRNRITNETTIIFFQHMPANLRRELDYNVYFPIISQHPVFQHCCSSDRNVVLQICSKAVTEQAIELGQEIFSVGDVGAYMYFVESGELFYTCQLCSEEEKQVIVPHFIAEASLWTKWQHRGTLVAEAICDVFLLSAAELETMFTTNRPLFSLDSVHGLRKYAAQYANRISQCDQSLDPSVHPITDLMIPVLTLYGFAVKAFPCSSMRHMSTNSNHSRVSNTAGASFLKYFRTASAIRTVSGL